MTSCYNVRWQSKKAANTRCKRSSQSTALTTRISPLTNISHWQQIMVYGWKAGLRTRIQIPVMTLHFSGLAGSEIWTKISGISRVRIKTGADVMLTVDNELPRELFVTQRRDKGIERFNLGFLIVVSKRRYRAYIGLVPIASQRVCLISLLSKASGLWIPTTPRRNAPSGIWILAFLRRVRRDQVLKL